MAGRAWTYYVPVYEESGKLLYSWGAKPLSYSEAMKRQWPEGVVLAALE